ncbi:hypothetical protein KVH06_14095 [Streptomyces olivaceus]|nr:hypothetical protein [Streptomyces olivaceus]MBZ6166257.1 hypothetical protein [Streptomyces olivaceus]
MTVVGIGADGWGGLPDAARRVMPDAEVVVGGPRQLDLLPPECAAERVQCPRRCAQAAPGLLATHVERLPGRR